MARFCGHMPRFASRVRVWGHFCGHMPRSAPVSAFGADFTDTHTDIAFVSVEKG